MTVIDKKLLDIINNNSFSEKLKNKIDRIYYIIRDNKYEVYLIISLNYIISIQGLGVVGRFTLYDIIKKAGEYEPISDSETFRRSIDSSDAFKQIIDKMKSTNEDYMITIYLSPTEIKRQKEEVKNTTINLYDAEDVKNDFIDKINRGYDFKIDKKRIKVDYKSNKSKL